jgi:hypothetical protein
MENAALTIERCGTKGQRAQVDFVCPRVDFAHPPELSRRAFFTRKCLAYTAELILMDFWEGKQVFVEKGV